MSGAGLAGGEELLEQARAAVAQDAIGLVHDGRAVEFPEAHKFPRTIAFDVIPLAGSIVDDGDSARPTRRRSSATRAARSSSCPACASAGTCVRVPVFTGHSLSINAEFANPITPERATELLADAPGVALSDVPTPLEAAGTDPSYVGRIRQDQGGARRHAASRSSSRTTTCARARR